MFFQNFCKLPDIQTIHINFFFENQEQANGLRNKMSVSQYLCPALKLEGGSPVDHQGEGPVLGGQVWGVPHHLTVQILVGVHCPCKQNQTWMKSCLLFYRQTVNDVMNKKLTLIKNDLSFASQGLLHCIKCYLTD